MNVLMSIRPEFADKIISKEKLYEFRKSAFGQNVSKIFIYSTAPRREIVGYFTPSKIITASPEKPLEFLQGSFGNFQKGFLQVL